MNISNWFVVSDSYSELVLCVGRYTYAYNSWTKWVDLDLLRSYRRSS